MRIGGSKNMYEKAYVMIICIIAMVIMLFKNTNVYRNQVLIIHAIAEYNNHLILNAKTLEELTSISLIPYSCMKSYSKTMWNFADWGYKNIVPSDIFEKIEPFIKKKGNRK